MITFFRLALLSEDNLPELLRKALQAKKEEEERDGILSGEGAPCLLMLAPSLPATVHLALQSVQPQLLVGAATDTHLNSHILHRFLPLVLSASHLCFIVHCQSQLAIIRWALF